MESIQIEKQLPLGKRVECFFEALIEHSTNYEMVLKNLQIIHNKNTLGELDFILYHKTKQIYEHVEMQYKFYVYDVRFEKEIHRYIGPNRNDTLYKKLEKLKNNQLPLLHKKQTHAFLNGIDVDKIEQKILFQANVFVPRGFQAKSLPLINDACICGYYLSYDEFIIDESFQEIELFLPHRFDWVSNPTINETWKSYDEVKEEIAFFINQKASPLVWSKQIVDNEVIFERFFVTWW